jgi:hypothetical protein
VARTGTTDLFDCHDSLYDVKTVEAKVIGKMCGSGQLVNKP